MKKVIFSIVIAVVSLLSSFSANADNASVQMKGDSMVVVDGKDTVTITMGKLKEFAAKINNRLDDTIVGNAIASTDVADAETELDADTKADAKAEIALAQIHKQNADQEKIFITQVTGIVFGTIFLIVLISLIVYYMRRRAKYRIIEKAIENGYPLPDSFYGNRPVMPQPIVMPQQPFAPQQPNAPQQPVTPQQPIDGSSCDAIYSRLRWHRGARSGFKLGIIGLAFLIFALMIQEQFFAAIGFIFLLIGAAKLAIAYFDTRVPLVPQQPVTPQTPVTPQQPVTPPPFNDARASNSNEEDKV